MHLVCFGYYFGCIAPPLCCHNMIQTSTFDFQGIEKKHAKLQGSEKAVVARHETGHAVVGTAVARLLPGQPRVEVRNWTTFLNLTLQGSFFEGGN